MIKRIILNTFACLVLIILLSLYFLRHPGKENLNDETKSVLVKKTDNGFHLFRYGEPFYIEGAAGDSHFKELASAGGNTIRIYDTVNLRQVLDEAYINNLAVIVDIPLPSYNPKYNYYANEANRKKLILKVSDIVDQYKNHPALLLWNLGNELFYPLVLRKNDFIDTFNELIDLIHTIDPNHPVCTTISGVYRKEQISIYIHSPKLDLLAFNIFGDVKNLQKKLKYISTIFGPKPYYISEFGSDGWWESETTTWKAPKELPNSKKAEQVGKRYKEIQNDSDGNCLGSLIFFWGYKHERTYTWFSLFKENTVSEIVKLMEALWKKSGEKISVMGIEGIAVTGMDMNRELIFIDGEKRDAELQFSDPDQKYDSIRWEIYHEEWSRDTTNMKLIYPEPVDSFIRTEKNYSTFITPSVEGPYRLFAYVYKDKYFSSANTPFYVLRRK